MLQLKATVNFAVAIKSCHKYTARRKAVAETWLPAVAAWADCFFLVGQPYSPSLPDSLACNVSDAFADIAPKVSYACFYALEAKIDRLLICDDDTFIVPDRLRIAAESSLDYVGFMRTSGLQYNDGIPYAQGSAYWLSRRAMAIVAESPAMVPGVIDDGAVGRALVGKVDFTHDYRYEPGPNASPAPAASNEIITTHKCLPEQMHRMWAAWRQKC